MKQDLLTELRAFFLKGGIEQFIYDFRNPSIDGIPLDNTYYDEDSDSIISTNPVIYADQFGQQHFSDHSIDQFLPTLIQKLNSFEALIRPQIENIRYNIRIESEESAIHLSHLKVIGEDIREIQTKIQNKPDLSSYKSLLTKFFDDLFLHIKADSEKQRENIPNKNLQRISIPAIDPPENLQQVNLNQSKSIAKEAETIIQKFSYVHFHTHIGNLTDLCNTLKEHGFIGKSVKLTDFKNAFGGNKELGQKIHWIGSLSALCYFIKALFLLHVVDRKVDKWKITKAIFCIEEGQEIKEDLKSQKEPKLHDIKLIDRMVKTLATK